MNTAVAVIEELAARGVTLRVVAGRLEVRPASALTDRDRTVIRACLSELVSELASEPGVPVWNLDDAIRRMHDADTLVKQLGVDGRHPAVQDAAGRGVEAFTASDPKAFRVALDAFVTVVGGVADAVSPRSEAA